MMPNFKVDSMIEAHLDALKRSGAEQWNEEGTSRIEFERRKLESKTLRYLYK
jgi:hypothetical protein